MRILQIDSVTKVTKIKNCIIPDGEYFGTLTAFEVKVELDKDTCYFLRSSQASLPNVLYPVKVKVFVKNGKITYNEDK